MKQFATRLAATFALTFGALSTPVFADVITFDDAAGNAALFQGIPPSLNLGGLTFSATGGFGANWASNPNGNGTNGMIYAGTSQQSFTIERTGGGTFDLANFEMGISWYADNASLDVLINGVNYSLGQGLQALNVGLVGVSAVTITGFSELTTYNVGDIGNGSGYWLLDNINFTLNGNRVPEPGSIALMGLGLLGLAAMRRRKLGA